MANNPKVTILVLNWNNYIDTKECLESIESIEYKNYSVIIIDNNSSDDSTTKIQKIFPYHTYIFNEENLGFSEGNNIGISHALDNGSDYILVMNNDVVVSNFFLKYLVKEVEKDHRIGIAVPKINYYGNKNIIWMAGGELKAIRGSGIPVGKDMDDSNYNKNRYITFASGCCMLISRDVFEKIGLWDKHYFLYAEDSDFCKRTIDTGYKILYCAKSKIYHKVSNTSKKLNRGITTYYAVRNRLYFSKKLYGNFHYVFIAFILFTSLIKFIVWAFKGNWVEVSYTTAGIRDYFYRHMGPINRKYKIE